MKVDIKMEIWSEEFYNVKEEHKKEIVKHAIQRVLDVHCIEGDKYGDLMMDFDGVQYEGSWRVVVSG